MRVLPLAKKKDEWPKLEVNRWNHRLLTLLRGASSSWATTTSSSASASDAANVYMQKIALQKQKKRNNQQTNAESDASFFLTQSSLLIKQAIRVRSLGFFLRIIIAKHVIAWVRWS